VAYRWTQGAWERYFPGQPDFSHTGPLNTYGAFLILVTASVSCTIPIVA